MDLLGGYGSDGSSSDSPAPAAPAGPAQVPKEKVSEEGSLKSNLVCSAPPGRKKAPIMSKRGKKLVSLHAVLPPHILEQLTNGTKDSDDEQTAPPRVIKPKASGRTVTTKKGADDGLTSLLSELGSFAASSKTTAKKEKQSAAPEGKMGHAFLQKKNAVSKTTEDHVVDIHMSTSQTPEVETVQLSDGEDRSDVQVMSMARPLSVRQTYQRNALPLQPQVRININRAPRTSNLTAPYAVAPKNSEFPVGEVESHRTSAADLSLGRTSGDARSKRSRKKMEKALRSGNMAAVDGHRNLQSLDAQQYVYSGEESGTTLAASHHQGTGVRVAPVAMYDTKAGKDVVGANVSGKARGKNQINYLMASAVAFEANQAQQAKAKTHRADAKRKYGW